MIKTFKHKGLKKMFYQNDSSKINPAHLNRITIILDILDQLSEVPKDLELYRSFRPHPYKGENNVWSMDVSGNYRILFRFEKGNVYDVDYLDPH
ncbi:MAG: type II toxin-antitoxin system RelE/ParE family toxin [Flavobacteriaceae bacterium]|jgi:proteic killer suppression protein|nr:type II toxin-antitoxin system RelE/ParE family toxin [Flavobacteriaceae bacterium]